MGPFGRTPLVETATGDVCDPPLDLLGAHTRAFLGVDLTAYFDPVADELQRRAQWSLGGVPDRSLLRVLFDLPSDVPVPRYRLAPEQRRRLRRAPAGVCEVVERDVVRRLVPALRLRHVVLRTRPTISAVHRLSRFAPFASRTLLSCHEQVSTPVLVEAQRLGIGVHTLEGCRLIDAVPFRPSRHSPAAWHMAEMVTDRVLTR